MLPAFEIIHGELGPVSQLRLEREPNIRVYPVEHPDRLELLIRTRKSSEALVIPEDFTSRMGSGAAPALAAPAIQDGPELYALRLRLAGMVKELRGEAAGTDSMGAGHAGIIVNGGSLRASARGESIAEVNRMMLVFIMGIMSYSVTAIVQDRRQGLLSRMFTAPLRPVAIALGSSLGSFLVGTLQIALVLLVTRLLFGYSYGGIPVLQQFAVLGLFLLASLGIACTAAGLVGEAGQTPLLQLLVILPTCMLGGCFWSREDMPEWLQRLSYAVPHSWTLETLKLLESGAEGPAVLVHLTILAAFAVVCLLYGSYLLKPGAARVG